MNQLRSFAQNQISVTTIVPGLMKDGKLIEQGTENVSVDRWGLWINGSGFSDGRNIAQVSAGGDYRLTPYLIVGALGTYWYQTRNQSGNFFQGGPYAAYYRDGFYVVGGGLFGANDLTGYGETGYDFRAGNFGFGPVESIQYDTANRDLGFGRGSLFQNRVGGRAYYSGRWVVPEVQVMWQHQSIDWARGRENALWAGGALTFPIAKRADLWVDYAIEANQHYQIHQFDLGLRVSFP